MAKVIPRKVREVKVLYVLYPFDRATTSKEGLHSPLKEVKKNLENPDYITAGQNEILKSKPEKSIVEIIPFILISSTEKGALLIT